MATALSGVTPTWVYPMEPQFHTIITQTESQKKNFLNLSGSTPVFKWKLVWEKMSDAKFWGLHKHFHDRGGGYAKFAWKDVPAYIDTDMDGTVDGSDVTVRYIAGSFKFSPNAHSWDAEVIVEKDF